MNQDTQGKGLAAVVFDWAGTTVDYGCQGPVQAFVEGFAALDIAVTAPEAREPMGMDKREHVAAMLAMPRIAAQWKNRYGEAPGEAAVDKVYVEVEGRMLSVITNYAVPMEGTLEAVAAMRESGLKIGSCTGYPRSVAEPLAARAKELGYAPDVMVCASDVRAGRPAPDMCLEVLKQLGVDDPTRAVKVGDTVNDVLEGRRAGMWVIGITLSGSMAGLSQAEVAALSTEEREALHRRIAKELTEAGAHCTAPDVMACLPLLKEIASRII